MKTLYTTRSHAHGGRSGTTEIVDGNLKLQLAIPKEMGGTGSEGANPEQLFACGYAACFGSAIDHISKMKKKQLKDINVDAHVSIGTKEGGTFGLEVKLEVHLPELSLAEAEEIVQEAHKICPYSNAIRGNVPVELTVK